MPGSNVVLNYGVFPPFGLKYESHCLIAINKMENSILLIFQFALLKLEFQSIINCVFLFKEVDNFYF